MDYAQRMMTIQVELYSRRLGGSALLISFADSMLASTTCRHLLQLFLAEYLNKPDLLASSEMVSMFIIKQHDNVSGSGRKMCVDMDLANATDCMDMTALLVIEAFSTHFFPFKVTSQPAETPQGRTLLNSFEVMLSLRFHSYFCLRDSSMHVCMLTTIATKLYWHLSRSVSLVGFVTLPKQMVSASAWACQRDF